MKIFEKYESKNNYKKSLPPFFILPTKNTIKISDTNRDTKNL